MDKQADSNEEMSAIEALMERMRDMQSEGEMSFPLSVAKIEHGRSAMERRSPNCGRCVSVRPVGDTRTHLGVYLGEMMLDAFTMYYPKSQQLSVIGRTNPAILVPALKRIVWGCESWWSFIDTPEQLRQISEDDIADVWYVKALREKFESAQAVDAVDPHVGGTTE